jgi:hypothetical protein
MKIIYSQNIYPLNEKTLIRLKNISGLILNLTECEDNKEVNLTLYEESFKLIYNGISGILLRKLKKEQIMDLYLGLKYFLVSEEFLNEFKKKASQNQFLKNEAEQQINEFLLEKQMEEDINDINWNEICSSLNLSVNFFERIIKDGYANFEALCLNKYIPHEFFQKLIDKNLPVDWSALCRNESIHVEFFEKAIKENKDIDWMFLSENKNLPVWFFEKAIKENKPVNYQFLCCNEKLPAEFFEKLILEGKPISWECLCRNRNLPLSFFKKYNKVPYNIKFFQNSYNIKFFQNSYGRNNFLSSTIIHDIFEN